MQLKVFTINTNRKAANMNDHMQHSLKKLRL